MSQLLFYMKKLHDFAGKKLYLILLCMMLIGVIDALSVYLLVPLLGMTGAYRAEAASVPFVAGFLSLFDNVQDKLRLPLVLGCYLALIVGQALLQRSQSIWNINVQQGFIRYLRLDIYQALLHASWSFFLRKRSSDFNHILTSELARVSQGTLLALSLASSLLFTAVQLGFAFWLSVELTLTVLVSGLILSLFARRFINRAKTLGDRTTELSQSYYAGVTDHFNGMKDIKSNRLEQTHLRWFRSISDQMEHNIVRLMTLQSTSQFIYRAVSAVLIVAFIFLAIEVMHVRPERLMLIVVIFSRLWPRFSGLQNNVEQIATTMPAFKSVLGLRAECARDKEENAESALADVPALQIARAIECRSVSFRYDPQSPVYSLKDINVTIPAGSMTAFAGKSGAGKSTLIDTLIGLIKPESGEVLIDGIPLSGETMYAYRNSIGYVSQSPFLFHTSIRDNLLLAAPNASEEELWRALTFSASDEFVRALPQGIDTVIGDRGVRLSGGERQRIVLARAILRKPSVLVLDEATSALDNENEAKIQQALDRLKGSMTIIVIAHRLSTIRGADQVIVLENGRIIQQGGYQQLSKDTKGSFNKLLAYQ